jgi:transposase
VRGSVLAFCRWAKRHHLTLEEAALRLGLSASTVRHWQTRWRNDRLLARGRGRPACRSPRHLRERALGLIGHMGPGVGAPTLQALCPQMARRELQDLLRRYRRVWRHRHRLLARMLHWQRAGTVWAMDFAEPPAHVDGAYGNLLAVRDLASGFQLLWLPAENACAATALAALQGLFRAHGRPLVLKTDNGSPFIADAFQSHLRRQGVWQLFSPPAWPRYNGSCEAGIGSMKTRTHHESARRGFPGRWTCDDMEAARLQANELARPWGLCGPTPEQSWQMQQPVSCGERQRFARTVRTYEQEQEKQRGVENGQRPAQREAIVRTLVRLGLLTFTATSVPDPYPSRRRRRQPPDSRG